MIKVESEEGFSVASDEALEDLEGSYNDYDEDKEPEDDPINRKRVIISYVQSLLRKAPPAILKMRRDQIEAYQQAVIRQH